MLTQRKDFCTLVERPRYCSQGLTSRLLSVLVITDLIAYKTLLYEFLERMEDMHYLNVRHTIKR